MGGGLREGIDAGFYRNADGEIGVDGLGRIFYDSANPKIREEYFKSPATKFYEALRGYVVNIVSRFKKQKDISSRL